MCRFDRAANEGDDQRAVEELGSQLYKSLKNDRPAAVTGWAIGTGPMGVPALRRASDELPSQAPAKDYRYSDRKDQVAVV